MKNTNITETFINGLYILSPEKTKNAGEIISQTYDQNLFYEMGLCTEYKFETAIETVKGVLRGLYYATEDDSEQLIRVLKGEVYYVAVDMRVDSKTRGKSYGIILNDKDNKSLYIPKGFALGYLVFSNEAKIEIKSNEIVTANMKTGILWNDPDLNIEWFTSRVDRIMISRKDQRWPRYSKILSYKQ